jgi:hypothetical protein
MICTENYLVAKVFFSPHFNGTVAGDFWPRVFMDLLYVAPRFRGKKDFLFFFVRLFKYFEESAL